MYVVLNMRGYINCFTVYETMEKMKIDGDTESDEDQNIILKIKIKICFE